MWFELNSFVKKSGFFRKEEKILRKTLSISISFFFFSLAWAILSPVFSIRVNEITGSVLISGWFFTTWGIIRLISDVPVGVFNNKIKPLKFLRISSFFYPLIVISYVLVKNITFLFILRIIHSFLGSLLWVSTWTLIRSLPSKKHVEENVGFFITLRNLPSVFGPAIAVLLLTIAEVETLFFISAGLLEIMFLILLKSKIKTQKIKEQSKPKIMKEVKTFFKTKKSYTISLIFIIIFLVSSGFGSFLPIILQEENFSIKDISILYSLSTIPALFLTMPASKFGDEKGKKPLVLISAFITVIGFLIFSQDSNFWIVLSSLTLINVGTLITSSTINSLVADLTIDGKSGSFSGIIEFFKDFGQIIGPIFAGYLLKASNYHTLSYAYMAFIFLVQILIYKKL